MKIDYGVFLVAKSRKGNMCMFSATGFWIGCYMIIGARFGWPWFVRGSFLALSCSVQKNLEKFSTEMCNQIVSSPSNKSELRGNKRKKFSFSGVENRKL